MLKSRMTTASNSSQCQIEAVAACIGAASDSVSCVPLHTHVIWCVTKSFGILCMGQPYWDSSKLAEAGPKSACKEGTCHSVVSNHDPYPSVSCKHVKPMKSWVCTGHGTWALPLGHMNAQLCHAHVYLKSFIRDSHVVMEELVSAIMTPEGRHLAQQHVILVVLAHGQACHLQHQNLI